MTSTASANININATDRTGRAIASARKNLQSFGSTAKSALGTIGVGLGVGAFVQITRSAIDYGSSLTDAATATNTNIIALQALRYAALEAGASEQQLDNALVRAQKSAIDATNGLSTMTRAYDALGINVDEFIKLPTERKMETIGRAMAAANNKQAAYAAAMDILGTRNAPKLLEVLNRLAVEGYDGVASAAQRAGQVMDEETAVRLDKAADSLAKFGRRLTITAGELVSFYSNVFEGNNPLTADIDAAVDAHKNQLSPAIREIINLQDMLALAIKHGFSTESIQMYQQEIEKLKLAIRENPEEKIKTPDVLEDDSQKMKRLQSLVRQYSEINSTPEQNISVLRDEIGKLQSQLKEFDNQGLRNTEQWADAYIAAMEKAIKLHGLEKAASADALREKERMIKEITQGSGASFEEAAPKKENPYVFGRVGHLYQDYIRKKSLTTPLPDSSANPFSTEASSPEKHPPSSAAESGTPADAVVQTIQTNLEKGTASLKKISESFTQFIQQVQILEQQVANAR